MTRLTDKHLMLLGILRAHGLHGYRLSELLASPGMPIHIGKANAYQLLDKLERAGFASHSEERVGNRPARRIYAIAKAGEAELDRLLRLRLASSVPDELPDATALNFVALLPPAEGASLLRQRLETLRERALVLRAVDDDQREQHPGFDLVTRVTELEVAFVEDLITKLEAAAAQG